MHDHISKYVISMDLCPISPIMSILYQHAPIHWKLCSEGQAIKCSFGYRQVVGRWLPISWKLCSEGQSIKCSFGYRQVVKRWLPIKLHQASHFVSKVFATNGASCWWVGEVQRIEATNTMYWACCWVKGVIVHLLCIMLLEELLLLPTRIMNISSPQFHIMVPKL